MIDRLIITAKNRAFPRLGDRMPAAFGCLRAAGERSSGVDAITSELPTHTGTTPASGATAEPSFHPPETPEVAPATSSTRPSCRLCGGCGWNYSDYISPLSKNWTREQVTCSRCHGTGYDEVAA